MPTKDFDRKIKAFEFVINKLENLPVFNEHIDELIVNHNYVIGEKGIEFKEIKGEIYIMVEMYKY